MPAVAHRDSPAARSLRIAALLAASLAFAPGAGVLAGQPPPSSLAIRCDPARNRLEFVVSGYEAPGAALVRNVTAADHTDCILADGTSIRIRTVQDLASAVGLCGANPPYYFSLWVNRRKVFSNEQFANCDGLVLRGVLVDGRIIRHCWFEAPAMGEGPWTCAEQPVPIRDAGRDYVEYPPPGTRPTQPGSLRLIANGNPRLCGLWADGNRPVDQPPPGGQEPQWERAPTAESGEAHFWAAPPVVAHLDFDNDGQLDEVWRIENRYAGFVGDYFFVVPAGTTPTAEWISELFGEEQNGWQYRARPPRQIVPENVIVYGGNVSTFRDRQIWWTAFRFEGRTYLTGWHWWDRVRHIVAEPHDGRLRTVCIFDRPRDNF